MRSYRRFPCAKREAWKDWSLADALKHREQRTEAGWDLSYLSGFVLSHLVLCVLLTVLSPTVGTSCFRHIYLNVESVSARLHKISQHDFVAEDVPPCEAISKRVDHIEVENNAVARELQ